MTIKAVFLPVVDIDETGAISTDWGSSFDHLYDSETGGTVTGAAEVLLPELLDERLVNIRRALNEALDIDVRFSELEDEVDTEAYIDAKYDAAELLGVLADLVRPFFARTEVQS
jgi:hypothetical protein